jgi:hypothetical protein
MPEWANSPRGLEHMTRHTLQQADPVWVSRDVFDMCDEARHSFQPEPMQPYDLFTPCGFALLPKPIMLKDVHGKRTHFRAFAWSVIWDAEQRPDDRYFSASSLGQRENRSPESASGLWITMFSHRDDDNEINSDYYANIPNLAHKVNQTKQQLRDLGAEEVGSDIDIDPDEYPSFYAAMKRVPFMSLAPLHVGTWPFGKSIDDLMFNPSQEEIVEQAAFRIADAREPDGGVGNVRQDLLRELAGEWWTSLQVIWRLAQQVITTPVRAARPARREAARFGSRYADNITVIKLRRDSCDIVGEPDWEGEGRLKHRFVVRGHWRNQWYPSIKTHRQIWINPFIKGPEDGELVLTDRVFEFVR